MKKSRNSRNEHIKSQTETNTPDSPKPEEAKGVGTKVSHGGPEVAEQSAQCWNCGSIASDVLETFAEDRSILRIRQCLKCGITFKSREFLKSGAVNVGLGSSRA